jgi:CRP-like cAMP-binding protein
VLRKCYNEKIKFNPITMSYDNVDVDVLLPILKQIPLFATLDKSLHEEIIKHIVLMYYPGDYSIFNQNDKGDALYIIKSGAVEIFHPIGPERSGKETVAQINTGGFFGEMALVSDQPRNASVRTLEDAEIFILTKDDFSKLLDENELLAEQISATVVSRIKENNQA